MPTIADIVSGLEKLAPPELAAAWDNVGLLLGDRASTASRVLTCLTLTAEVAAEAIAGGFQLIVTHHPILFRGVKQLTADSPEGRALLALARAGVAVYSPHTAFDDTAGGINDRLCDRLGVGPRRPLRSRDAAGDYKIVVFVPEADLAKLSVAMFAAGAGRIGEYRECSFRIPGTGTFLGGDAANPAVGRKGRREEVAEFRLEVVCPKRRLAAVLSALRQAHSYEEPAIDVYPTNDSRTHLGQGRIGELPRLTPVEQLGRHLRESLRCGPVQLVGEADRAVARVAVACGAAGELFADAVQAGAELFVTGEMRFHDYLAAQAAGVALLLPGHYASERFAVEELATRLNQVDGIDARASAAERDPVRWV